MTNDQADEAFQTLHDAQRQAQLLYMDLRDAGDQTGAASAKLRVNRLQTEIDNLINKELDEWQANAEKLLPQLSDIAGAVQKAVADVEADVQNAKKVVQAMKALDKIISAAVKFVG
jgi:predicted  nucleic acid-binding Zn-ribbon protein